MNNSILSIITYSSYVLYSPGQECLFWLSGVGPGAKSILRMGPAQMAPRQVFTAKCQPAVPQCQSFRKYVKLVGHSSAAEKTSQSSNQLCASIKLVAADETHMHVHTAELEQTMIRQ